ncbi:hypothetical protein PSYPI_11243 [Pseudomonas syringae pv. pisi str. 1704B]|uniref:Uncharacterized protein n=1 Tax=Pseudomonas syringae pv. pisi str. 1704B TaxID=629263 RepID=F3G786_PSESJ|nr:hypothetical protein PSYPI_11243 [Pseudomonas syringae pv. pisi str. 1704B]
MAGWDAGAALTATEVLVSKAKIKALKIGVRIDKAP